MQLLICETPDFIAPFPWLVNSLDFSQYTTESGGSCRSVCNAAGFMTSPGWSCVSWKSGNILNFQPDDQLIIDEAARQWCSRLQACIWAHEEYFLNTFDFCTWHFTCLNVVSSGHWMFASELTKVAVTSAGVDGFYWNLVICLRLDVILMVQNLVKIRHCLQELLECIHWCSFSPDTL